tara:strand:- start:5351 stop:5587 length:237 start_codon:yes stop_codon:yes gene_type:complete
MSERISRILKECKAKREILEEENFEELLIMVSTKLELVTEQRGNASVEGVITKLRAAYRANQLMTFRQFLEMFSDIIG